MRHRFSFLHPAMLRTWPGLLALALSALAGPSCAADLSVRLQNILSSQGKLRLALYGKDEFFPVLDDYENPPPGVRALLIDPQPIRGEQVVVFRDLPPGRYAVAVHHNVSGSGRFNRQLWPFTGMPTEPYGFSRNQWSLLGSPRLSDTTIEVGDQDVECDIWVSTHLSKVGGSRKGK